MRRDRRSPRPLASPFPPSSSSRRPKSSAEPGQLTTRYRDVLCTKIQLLHTFGDEDYRGCTSLGVGPERWTTRALRREGIPGSTSQPCFELAGWDRWTKPAKYCVSATVSAIVDTGAVRCANSCWSSSVQRSSTWRTSHITSGGQRTQWGQEHARPPPGEGQQERAIGVRLPQGDIVHAEDVWGSKGETRGVENHP
jgi:hypothetical protein